MKESASIFTLCFIPRLIYLALHWPVKIPSNSYYWRLSDSLLRYGTLGFEGSRSTAFEPLYPVFLAASRWVARDNFLIVMTLQLIVASIGCVYFHKLCLLLSKNKAAAEMGALLYSFYPYLVRQSVAILEVTPLATLLILSAYHYFKATNVKGSLLSGIVFGLTILTRTAVIPIWFFAVISLILKRHVLNAFLMAGAALLLILPFSMRNYFLDGSIVLSRSGLNLFEGNCKYSDKIIPAYGTDLLNPYAFELLGDEKPEFLKAGENAMDRFWTEKAVQFMKDNPLGILRLKLLNVAYLFYPRIVPFYPMEEKERLTFLAAGALKVENLSSRGPLAEWAYTISYGFIFLTALYGLFLRRNEFANDSILHCITFGFIVVYSLYWPATRLRAPMDFVLMFYSACAISRWLPPA